MRVLKHRLLGYFNRTNRAYDISNSSFVSIFHHILATCLRSLSSARFKAVRSLLKTMTSSKFPTRAFCVINVY